MEKGGTRFYTSLSFPVACIISDSLFTWEWVATMTVKLPMLPHSSCSGCRVWEFFISLWGNEWSDWGAVDGDYASFTNTHSLSHDLHYFFCVYWNDRKVIISGFYEQQALNSPPEEHSWLHASDKHSRSVKCNKVILNVAPITILNVLKAKKG